MDEVEHMAKIMELRGVPPPKVFKESKRWNIFFKKDHTPHMCADSKGNMRRPNSKNLAELLKTKDPDLVDFLDKCLLWDKDERLSPSEAFEHPFITKAILDIKMIDVS